MKPNNLIIKLILIFSFVTSGWGALTCSFSKTIVAQGEVLTLSCDAGIDLPSNYDLRNNYDGLATYYVLNGGPRNWNKSISENAIGAHTLEIALYKDNVRQLGSITQTFTVAAPTVSSVSPTSATAGTSTTFTLSGANLPSTIAMSLAGSQSCGSPFNVTATSAKVTCTPSSTGSQRFYVASQSGGSAISGSTNLYVTVAAANQIPTVTINTPTNSTGTKDQKNANFNLSITVKAPDGLQRIAYGVYDATGSVVGSGFKDVTGVQSTQTFTIDIASLSVGGYKIKFLVTDVNTQVSKPTYYLFDKISANSVVAYSVSPTSAIVGVETTFQLIGQNLPTTIYMKMDNTRCGAVYNTTSTSASIKCTPNTLGGQRFYVFSKNSTDLNDLINGSSQFNINVIEQNATAEAEVFRQGFINYDPKVSTILKSANMAKFKQLG